MFALRFAHTERGCLVDGEVYFTAGERITAIAVAKNYREKYKDVALVDQSSCARVDLDAPVKAPRKRKIHSPEQFAAPVPKTRRQANKKVPAGATG